MASNSSYPRAGDRTPSACAQREEYWRRILARQRQSGLTAADFCRRGEIKPSALSWWARELRERGGERSEAAEKKSPPKKAPPSAFVRVKVVEAAPHAAGAEAGVEVVTRSGHVLRLRSGFDPATLRRAVAALEARP